MGIEILTGLGSFKTMLDLAKRVKDIGDVAARNAIAVELQEKILTAQEQQSALVKQVGELEKEVAELKAWDADKQNYELKEFASGQFAYALKEAMRIVKPAHMLCANCYHHDEKSILQTETRSPGRHKVTFCQNCGSELFSPSSGGRDGQHPVVNRGGGSWGRARRGK